MAGGKKWESCDWTGAGWHNCSKLLELGPEVAGQFRVVVLIGKIKRDTVYKEDSQGIQLQKNICDFEVLPGYAGRKCAETRSILLHHVLPVYYTLGMSLGPMKQYEIIGKNPVV